MTVSSRLRPYLSSVLVAATLVSSLPAHAQNCDPDTEARLEFLETRLEEGQRNEKWWWKGWMTVFTIGVAFKVTEAALESDGSNAAASYIAAGKSVLGIANLTLRPHVGRLGAAPMQAIPKTSAANCAERLRLAEKNMELASRSSSERWSWGAHISSLALNLAAGIVTSEALDDPGTGWRDFAVSEVSSELHIWTHPTLAADSWAAYRAEFSGVPVARAPATLRFAALPGGVGIRWKF